MKQNDEEMNDELPIITRENMMEWMSNKLPDEILVEEDFM